jgi:hypothetical protein
MRTIYNQLIPYSEPIEVLAFRELTLDSDGASSSQPTDIARVPFSEALEFGYLALVDTVHDYELERHHSFTRKFELEEWRRAGVDFLAAMPNKLLDCLIQGNIAKEWASGDPELAELFGKYKPPKFGPESDTLFDQESVVVCASLCDTALLTCSNSQTPTMKHFGTRMAIVSRLGTTSEF